MLSASSKGKKKKNKCPALEKMACYANMLKRTLKEGMMNYHNKYK